MMEQQVAEAAMSARHREIDPGKWVILANRMIVGPFERMFYGTVTTFLLWKVVG